MKNRKGFTLIELIAVIVILGLVVLIAVPFFQGSLKTFRDDYYSALKTNVVNSAKDFFSDNKLYLPNKYLESAKVDLNTLEEKKYLKDVKDYEGNLCDLDSSYVLAVKTSREKYEYAVCIRCSGDDFEDVESVYCNKAWDKKFGHTEVILDNPSKVMVYKGTSKDKLKELVKVYPEIRRCAGTGAACEDDIKRVSAEGAEGVQAIYPINIDTIDTDKVGTYTVQYKYDETSPLITGEVEVYEHQPANISAKKYNTIYDTRSASNNDLGKALKQYDVESDYDQNDANDWAQKLNIRLNYTGSINGKAVKVARYQWYRNGRWEDYCVPVRANATDTNNGCNKTIGNVSGSNEQFNDTIKFRFIDVDGNISKEQTYKIRIDFTPPEACTLKLTGDIRNGWYYSSSVKIEFTYKDDASRTSPNGTTVKSGLRLYGISSKDRPTTNSTSGTHTADTTNVTWYGYTEDKAENFTICSISFKKDSTAPSCTDRGDNTTWKNTSVTVYWGCSDATSTCATAEASQTFNGNDTFTKTWDKAAYDIYDKAGNKTTCPAKTRNIYYDKKVPTCTDRGDNTTWKNTAVTVYWGCADQTGASGCKTAEASQSFNGNNTFTKTWTKSAYDVYDNAGNKTTCPAKTRNIYYDKQVPTCVSSGGNSAWRNTNLTLTGTCTDQSGASGCAGNVTKTYSTNTNSTTESPGTVKDNAGNTTTCPGNQTVKIDKTAPTCTSSGGSSAWRNTDLTIKGTCADQGGSGCVNAEITKKYTSNTNTTTASPGTVNDTAGNSVTCPGNQEVHIDKTAPTCSSGGGSSTWRNTNLTIKGTCNDTGGSGVKTCPSNEFSSNTNTTTASAGTVVDNAGNTASCTANQTVKIDKTKPTCSTEKSNTGKTSGVTVTVTCDDTGGSGVNTCPSGGSGHTSTQTYTVTDNAGNSKTCTASVTAQNQKRTKSCSSGKSCSDAGCHERNSCRASTCGCAEYNQVNKSKCYMGSGGCRSSCPGACDEVGGSCKVSCTWTENGTCKTYNSCVNSSCTCKTYNVSISECGCDSWGDYGSWSDVSSCSEGQSSDHSTYTDCQVVYN